MILLEALVISGVAGYVGLLGVAMAAIAVLVVSGTLAGLFPGMLAARVKPALVLRDEQEELEL